MLRVGATLMIFYICMYIHIYIYVYMCKLYYILCELSYDMTSFGLTACDCLALTPRGVKDKSPVFWDLYQGFLGNSQLELPNQSCSVGSLRFLFGSL